MQTEIQINDEFKKAFDSINGTSQNVFLTGKAGTGKSTFLRYLTANTDKRFVLLAPTGVAALNIGGETIHSFFRFHPNMTDADIAQKAKYISKESIYRNIDLIIIDEISMVRADLLDQVDMFLQKARRNNMPFGGLQMLFVGDLYQLPPVVQAEEEEFFTQNYASPYFFDAKCLQNKSFFVKYIELQHVYRQTDKEFVEILNAVRTNTANSNHLQQLNSRFMPSFEDNTYITLTTTNQRANQINNSELAKLPSNKVFYRANVTGQVSSSAHPTEDQLALAAGAVVMFLNNDAESRWVNGTIGTITETQAQKVIVQTEDGHTHEVVPHDWEIIKYKYQNAKIEKEVTGSFKQLPLRLAWAITIHKSQGKTFDKLILDIGWGTFAHGQVYVALSRCRSLDGIVLKKPLRAAHIKTDIRIVNFFANIESDANTRQQVIEAKSKDFYDAITQTISMQITYLHHDGRKQKYTVLPTSLSDDGKLGVYIANNSAPTTFELARIIEYNLLEQLQVNWDM